MMTMSFWNLILGDHSTDCLTLGVYFQSPIDYEGYDLVEITLTLIHKKLCLIQFNILRLKTLKGKKSAKELKLQL